LLLSAAAQHTLGGVAENLRENHHALLESHTHTQAHAHTYAHTHKQVTSGCITWCDRYYLMMPCDAPLLSVAPGTFRTRVVWGLIPRDAYTFPTQAALQDELVRLCILTTHNQYAGCVSRQPKGNQKDFRHLQPLSRVSRASKKGHNQSSRQGRKSITPPERKYYWHTSQHQYSYS
jgi:hypothetical protein